MIRREELVFTFACASGRQSHFHDGVQRPNRSDNQLRARRSSVRKPDVVGVAWSECNTRAAVESRPHTRSFYTYSRGSKNPKAFAPGSLARSKIWAVGGDILSGHKRLAHTKTQRHKEQQRFDMTGNASLRIMAEGVGVEPTGLLRDHVFSRHARQTDSRLHLRMEEDRGFEPHSRGSMLFSRQPRRACPVYLP